MVSEPARASDLEPGDKVIINVADRSPTPLGVFIVHDGFGLVAKRIQAIVGFDPPTIEVSSNNEKYKPYRRALEEANIVGWVVFRSQRIS